jgi:hypothetical protein
MNRWSLTTMSGLVLTATFTLAGTKASTAPPHLEDEINPDRPECPHNYVKIGRPKEVELANGPPISAPATMYGTNLPAISSIPEFNDCQRIVLESGHDYGPLMSVFASDRLGQVRFAKGTTSEYRAIAAVQVLNYALAYYYRPLGIKPLFNCLYLWGYPGQFHARMVWKQTDIDCAPVLDTARIGPGTTLGVIEAPEGALSNISDYPAAARWEWDSEHRIQYIGLRCGAAWCQVGPADGTGRAAFNPTTSYIDPPTVRPSTDAALGAARVRAVKGWYDEQQLAYVTKVDGKPVAKVSGVHGWVFPAPQLAKYERLADFTEFRPVAYVALEATDATQATLSTLEYYKAKFNYDVVPRGSPLSEMTEIAVCSAAWEACFPNPRLTPAMPPCATPILRGDATASRWWARLRSRATHNDVYRCVTRRTHNPVPNDMPASARWRWLASDETTWDYCMSGCCETEGHY